MVSESLATSWNSFRYVAAFLLGRRAKTTGYDVPLSMTAWMMKSWHQGVGQVLKVDQ